jgi:transposase
VRRHTGKEIRVVLDNLSTHTTPDVLAWLEKNPNVTFHFTPVGSSWLNQIVRHEVAREQRYSSKEVG